MKHTFFLAACAALLLTACGQNKCNCNCGCANCTCKQKADSSATDAAYKVADKANIDISKYPVDKDGFITLFDGKTLDGWRCYGKDKAGSDWNVEDGAIHLKGSGNGEGGGVNGGDLIFAHKFKNF